MAREKSWDSRFGAAMLRQITSLGYVVSVFRIPSSLLGTVDAFVEMHEIDSSTDPPIQPRPCQHRQAVDIDYRCALCAVKSTAPPLVRVFPLRIHGGHTSLSVTLRI
jgi:hypothetical protein